MITKEKFFEYFLIASAYYLFCRIGIYFTSDTQASLIWPASGLGIILLKKFGLKSFPAIALGALFANIQTGGSLLSILSITSANTIESFIGGYALRNFNIHSKEYKLNLKILFLILMACLASSFVGVTALYIEKISSTQSYWQNILTWFMGNLNGILIIIPCSLLLNLNEISKITKSLLAEAITAISYLFVAYIFLNFEAGIALLFFLFPLLVLTHYILNASQSFIFLILINFFITFFIIHSDAISFSIYPSIYFQLLLVTLNGSSLLMIYLKRNHIFNYMTYLLLPGLTVSALLFSLSYNKNIKNIESKFQSEVKNSILGIHHRFQEQIIALKSGVGLFAASKEVDNDEWIAFSKELKIEEQQMGALGIGVVFRVKNNEIEEYKKKLINLKVTNLTIKTLSNDLRNNEAYIITYISPLVKNQNALGLDLATELTRKEAADYAAKGGHFSISKSIKLVQANNSNAGFLIFYPLYTHGLPPATEGERLKRNIGWIYSPIITADFFKRIIKDKSLLYSSYQIVEPESNTVIAEDELFSKLSENHLYTQSFTISNRSYLYKAKPNLLTMQTFDPISAFIGFVSVVMTLLISLLFYFIKHSELSAKNLVDTKTRELEYANKVAKMGGWVFDSQTKTILLSKSAQFILQIKKNELKIKDEKIVFDNLYNLKKIYAKSKKSRSMLSLRLSFLTELKQQLWLEIKGEWIDHIFSGTLQDITTNVLLEKELEEERERSIHTSKLASIGELSASIAHEINNPLSIINGNAQLLIESLASGQELSKEILTKQLKKINENSIRISKIISGLRTLSRNEVNDSFEEVDFNSIINEALGFLEQKFKNESIIIKCDLHYPDLKIHCSRTQIFQVLVNLLNNSIDAIKNIEQKWILLELLEKENEIVFTLTDSGGGIPDDILNKIMLPFYTTKSIGKGTGLGLSISHGIIKKHHGSLTIDTKSINTKFIITLPKIK